MSTSPRPATPTLRCLLADATAQLGDRLETEVLLAHALGRDRAWLFAHADEPIDAAGGAAFARLQERRVAGEPVAYLTGRRGFWSLELEVTPATLIPRPETERLVELALERIPATTVSTVADLGTGSGAVALALAAERPQARVLATDADAEALAVAARNARCLRLSNVMFARGDWCDALGERQFHVIASNPPYIEDADAHLGEGDLRSEPRAALASGADGLDAIRRIVRHAPTHLLDGGWLLLEHGWRQGEAVCDLLRAAGFDEVFTARDLEQRERVSAGRWHGVASQHNPAPPAGR